MVKITDATGSGRGAEVSTENRLKVTSVSVPSDQHVNEFHQRYYSLPFDAIDPVGADDYFFYIENTGTKNLHLTDFRIRSTVAGTIEVHHVSGTPSYTADTDVTPVNRYIGDSGTITATIKTDTNTTGLTNEGIIFYQRLDTANEEFHLKTSSHVIIPPGQKVALLWDAATGALSGVISIYEEQPDV